MKENNKVMEFRLFFNDYKHDLEKDLENYVSMNPGDLRTIHKGYDILKRDIYRYEFEVKGALHFLRDMGYLDRDKSYDLFCEITDYFSKEYLVLNDYEGCLFKKYIDAQEQNPQLDKCVE